MGYTSSDIRNIVMVGHAQAGKTSLVEAILHKQGKTNRLGSVTDKTSILDCDEEERQRGHSVDSGLAYVEYKGKTINIIDTPGYPDFIGAALPALVAAETAVLVISAADGIQMNTRKMMQAAQDRGMASVIVVNKIDGNTDNISSLVETIQETFGMECRCANMVSSDGKSVIDCIENEAGDGVMDIADIHMNLVETIVEADEELMEAYLGGEEISKEKLTATFSNAVASRQLIPIVFTSSREEVGINELMEIIANDCPSPLTGVKLKVALGEGEEQVVNELACDENEPVMGIVFRISSDPKTNIKNVGIRLQTGKIGSDTTIQVVGGKKGMRCGHIHKLQGDKMEPIEDGIAGDVVVLAKLDDVSVLDTVYVGKEPGRIVTPKLPVPMYSLALEPKSRGDETKISGALHEIADADPTFAIDRDQQTNELIISGVGELHTRVVLSRMQSRRNLEVNTRPPRIPYRETITSAIKGVEYTHKKQSGGAGQFARVVIDVEPNEPGGGYIFEDKIFGGAIDQPFRPSVDKGIQAAMSQGVLAGFPVVDVKVALVDGKTHPVDSKDIAFQTAGREAFREAFMKCRPTLLEPIVNLEVTIPVEKVGDITGDLSGRRGRVQGQDMLPGDMVVVKAQVPLAEIQQYSSQLKSVTGGQGSFSMELSHYESAPPNIVQQVVEKMKAMKSEES